MSKRESIARYNLIIKKLRKQPSSFSEISDYLAFESDLQEYNFNVSKRTFQRDIEDIRSVYNIDIQYDFSRKVYYIDFDEQPEINERILEAFDTFNALNITDRLSNYIHFEKRRPQGTENLYGLLHAIKNNVNEHFKYCFGIISPNEHKPQEVILSFDPFQGKYIKTLPLHESPEILKDNEDELLIKLTLFVRHDFFMEMISFGDNVKVIQAVSLIAEIKKAYENALKLY